MPVQVKKHHPLHQYIAQLVHHMGQLAGEPVQEALRHILPLNLNLA
jgi:hypothetical protein